MADHGGDPAREGVTSWPKRYLDKSCCRKPDFIVIYPDLTRFLCSGKGTAVWEDGVYEALPLCPDPAVVWLNQTVHCPMIQQAMQSADAIHLAAEVGRLDIVSLILAGFGMLIAILAVAAFFEIRSKAKQIATEEARIAATRAAREAARPEAARVTVEWLEQSGIDWQKLAALAPVARQSSQDFADALNDGGEENGHDSSG